MEKVNKGKIDQNEIEIKRWAMDIPLTYNREYTLGSDYRCLLDFRLQDGFESCVFDIIDNKDLGLKDSENWSIGNAEDESGNHLFNLHIEKILSDSKESAIRNVARCIDTICMALSFCIITHNNDKEYCNPKVYCYYQGIKARAEKIDSNDYTELVIDKAGNREIFCREEIGVTEASELRKIIEFTNNEFIEYAKAISSDNPDVFALKQYYLALGEEHITSKYFHLFSIIEYIEDKYSEFAGANLIFDNSSEFNVRVGEFVDELLEKYQSGKNEAEPNKDDIYSSINKLLIKMTNYGRATKLLNILKHMGIEFYTKESIPLDKALLQSLIRERNILFHGNEAGDEEIRKHVLDLMYIDLKIIQYLIKQF